MLVALDPAPLDWLAKAATESLGVSLAGSEFLFFQPLRENGHTDALAFVLCRQLLAGEDQAGHGQFAHEREFGLEVAHGFFVPVPMRYFNAGIYIIC
jgi:hypothetical protein